MGQSKQTEEIMGQSKQTEMKPEVSENMNVLLLYHPIDEEMGKLRLEVLRPKEVQTLNGVDIPCFYFYQISSKLDIKNVLKQVFDQCFKWEYKIIEVEVSFSILVEVISDFAFHSFRKIQGIRQSTNDQYVNYDLSEHTIVGLVPMPIDVLVSNPAMFKEGEPLMILAILKQSYFVRKVIESALRSFELTKPSKTSTDGRITENYIAITGVSFQIFPLY
jgi:hypothetical protein